MESDIFSILKDFGLSDMEIKVYLSGLAIGAQPASVIAKKSGIKRSHCYNVISQLMGKRIMQEFTKDKMRFFNSRPPHTILSIMEHRQSELETQKRKIMLAMPELEKIKNKHLSPSKIHFFQGPEGMKEIYEDTLKYPNTEIFGFADFDYCLPKDGTEDFNKWLWTYTVRRAKKKIKYYGILNKSASGDFAHKHRKEQNRVMKMLMGVHFPVEINIYGDKVAIVSIYRDYVGIIIEEPNIAASLRNLHKAIWKFLPDYK